MMTLGTFQTEEEDEEIKMDISVPYYVYFVLFVFFFFFLEERKCFINDYFNPY